MDTAHSTPTPAAPTPQPHHTPHTEHHAAAHDYPSSPFLTAKLALSSFFANGKKGLPVMLLVQFLLFLATIFTFGIALVAFLASVLITILQSSNLPAELQIALNQLPTETIQALNGATYAPFLGVIGLVALVASLFVGTYLQALMGATVTETTVEQKSLVFSEAMRLAARRFWPILWQTLLATAAVFVAIFVLIVTAGVLAGTDPQPGTYVLVGLMAIALFIVAMYLTVRFSMAQFAILTENKGPIESLKYSWQLTKGHVWEVMGIIALSGLISLVANTVFDLLTRAITNEAVLLLLALIFFVVMMLGTLACFALLAKRYQQLRSAPADHKSRVGLNLLAIGLLVVAYIIVGALLPQETPTRIEDYTPPSDYDTSLPTDTSDMPTAEDMDAYEQQLREQYPELFDDTYDSTQTQ